MRKRGSCPSRHVDRWTARCIDLRRIRLRGVMDGIDLTHEGTGALAAASRCSHLGHPLDEHMRQFPPGSLTYPSLGSRSICSSPPPPPRHSRSPCRHRPRCRVGSISLASARCRSSRPRYAQARCWHRRPRPCPPSRNASAAFLVDGAAFALALFRLTFFEAR